MVSGSRETPVWCMIYEDLEYEAEADIFANQMKYVKPLAPYEIFMANIEAGNDKQLIIRDLVESYGLCLTRTSTPGGICAISTLEKIHDRFGYLLHLFWTVISRKVFHQFRFVQRDLLGLRLDRDHAV